jgi:large subunit ribosomal protein L23
MKNLSIFPRVTEKAYAQSKNNIYLFDAPTSANKNQIASAIEAQFGVKVVSVKTLVRNGKVVRVSRGKHANPASVTKADTKKAYVMLAEGDKIKVFDEEAIEAETKPKEQIKESKDTKVTVKSEKKEKK